MRLSLPWILFVAAACLASAVAIILVARSPLPWSDEATHLVDATRFAQAIATLNPRRIAGLVRGLRFYPFGGALLLSPAVAMSGGHLMLRVLNLFYLAASVALLIALCASDRSVPEPNAGSRAPLIATLTISSPAILLHSTMILLEPAGLFVVTLTFYLHALAHTRSHPWHLQLVVALLSALAIFVKFNIGLPLFAALLLHIACAEESLRTRAISAAIVVGGAIGPVLLWLLVAPGGLSASKEMVVNRSSELGGIAALTFYPRAFCSAYCLPWIGVPVLLLFALAALNSRDPMYGAPILYALVALAMLTIHPLKNERYLYTIAPFIYLGALVAAERSRVVRRWIGNRGSLLLPAAASVLFITCAFQIFVPLSWPMPLLGHPARQQALDFVSAAVPCRKAIYVTGTFNEVWHDLVRWSLAEHCGTGLDEYPLRRLGGAGGEWRSQKGAHEREAYRERLDDVLRKNPSASFVSIDLPPSSVFRTSEYENYQAWQENYSSLLESYASAGRLALSDKKFETPDLRIRIYTPAQTPGVSTLNRHTEDPGHRWSIRVRASARTYRIIRLLGPAQFRIRGLEGTLERSSR